MNPLSNQVPHSPMLWLLIFVPVALVAAKLRGTAQTFWPGGGGNDLYRHVDCCLVTRAVEMNLRWTQRAILDSPEGRARSAEGRIKCVGAVYEIETGRVQFLAPAPVRETGGPRDNGGAEVEMEYASFTLREAQ